MWTRSTLTAVKILTDAAGRYVTTAVAEDDDLYSKDVKNVTVTLSHRDTDMPPQHALAFAPHPVGLSPTLHGPASYAPSSSRHCHSILFS